jgi:hypothetical protein
VPLSLSSAWPTRRSCFADRAPKGALNGCPARATAAQPPGRAPRSAPTWAPSTQVVGRRGGSTPPPTTGRSSPSPVTSSGWAVTAAYSRDPGRSDRLPAARAISLFFPVGGEHELVGCTGNGCKPYVGADRACFTPLSCKNMVAGQVFADDRLRNTSQVPPRYRRPAVRRAWQLRAPFHGRQNRRASRRRAPRLCRRGCPARC